MSAPASSIPLPRPSSRKATLYGFVAIALWSVTIGMLRSVSERAGPVGGAALIYGAGALCLLALFRPPPARLFAPRYLLVGGGLFVLYELMLSLSVGLAVSREQALVVGLINYLWPLLTVLCAVLLNGERLGLLALPGFALSLYGVACVFAGSMTPALAPLVEAVRDAPLSPAMALAGALCWALYCALTRRWAGGRNGVTWFFCATAAVLLAMAVATGALTALPDAVTLLQAVLAGAALSTGYALWNVAMLHGRVTLITGAAYATPVLSSAFAAVWLGASTSPAFWWGALLVSVGALLCWQAGRRR